MYAELGELGECRGGNVLAVTLPRSLLPALSHPVIMSFQHTHSLTHIHTTIHPIIRLHPSLLPPPSLLRRSRLH